MFYFENILRTVNFGEKKFQRIVNNYFENLVFTKIEKAKKDDFFSLGLFINYVMPWCNLRQGTMVKA